MRESYTIKVAGMGCQGCVSAVEKAIGSIDPKAIVRVDLQSGSVKVENAEVTITQAGAAITAAGYDLAA